MGRVFVRNVRDFKSLNKLKHGNYIVTLESDLDFKDELMNTIYISSSHIILDGKGHTISNIVINKPNYDLIGLFNTWDRVSKIAIKNLNFENIYIKARNYVGLIGGTFNGTIKNCKINGFVNGNSFVGGLVGVSSEKLVVASSDLNINSTSLYGNSQGVILGNGKKLVVKNCNIDNIYENSKYYVICEKARIERIKYNYGAEETNFDLSLKRKK